MCVKRFIANINSPKFAHDFALSAHDGLSIDHHQENCDYHLGMRMNIKRDECELLGTARMAIALPPQAPIAAAKKFGNCTISGAYLVPLGWLINSFNNLSVVYFINNR